MYRLLGPHQRRFLAASAAVGVLHPSSPAVIPLDPDPDPDRASPLSSSAGVAFCQGSRKKKHAINVMLQHRRSVLARSLEEVSRCLDRLQPFAGSMLAPSQTRALFLSLPSPEVRA